MPIHIYNSLARKKDEFIPLHLTQITMYVCGPTVYDEPHIGHARSAYIFDVIRRYLAYRGYDVKFVRNITDVDDKIIDKARKEYDREDLNTAFKKVAQRYLDEYHDALNKLEIDANSVIEPKASEYIEKMILFIKNLIDKGVAYSSKGDVYFDITKAKNYGKLSHQSLDKMEIGARVTPGELKKNPLDFALWKSAKSDEPSWESPWGKGRPGWHIECSVMSSDTLGDEFDIHGGGLDLIFPHHENEIAQSEGAGKKFARYWIHHGLLTINGQKMSKSLGNFITVKDFMSKYKDANMLKLFFLSAHYSHPIDYTEEKIKEARTALERISILMGKIERTVAQNRRVTGKFDGIENTRNKFIAAMDDDFNTPKALAAIFDLVNLANRNIDNVDFIHNTEGILKELLELLGVSFKFEKPTTESQTITSDMYVITEEEWISKKIEERAQFKKEKKYSEADKIRKELEEKGIILEDTKDGKTTWRRKL